MVFWISSYVAYPLSWRSQLLTWPSRLYCWPSHLLWLHASGKMAAPHACTESENHSRRREPCTTTGTSTKHQKKRNKTCTHAKKGQGSEKRANLVWELITNIEQRRVVPTKKTEVADSYKSLSNLTITICVWSQVLSLSYMHTVVSSPVMQHAQTNDESIVSREL